MSLNHFLVHQPVATNSMHLQPHPHHTFTADLVGSAFEIQSEAFGEAIFAKTVNVLRPLAVSAEELHRFYQNICNFFFSLNACKESIFTNCDAKKIFLWKFQVQTLGIVWRIMKKPVRETIFYFY